MLGNPQVWGYVVDVRPGSEPEEISALAADAFEQLIASLTAEGLVPVGKPRLAFVRGIPELLVEGETLTHKWLASVPVRRPDDRA